MSKNILNAVDFYDQFTPDYDRMIRFEQRMKNEQPVFKKLLKKYLIHSAMDAACGTGLHVIMLNKMGIKTCGADISEKMLMQAKANTRQYECEADIYLSPMQGLDKKVNKTFDAVFCLGNSLPHILKPDELKSALHSFYNLLNRGGVLIIGMLNFERVRLKNERILSINRHGENEYIRFYDINEDSFYFNILNILWQNGQASHQLQTTKLLPYSRDHLDEKLLNAGFDRNEYKGSLRLEAYQPAESKNLVVISRKMK